MESEYLWTGLYLPIPHGLYPPSYTPINSLYVFYLTPGMILITAANISLDSLCATPSAKHFACIESFNHYRNSIIIPMEKETK